MKKVIIIDDSATSLNLLKTTFAKNFWEVYGAQNAKIGYEMIYDVAPDLIITDAIMPLMGGFQLIKLIREKEAISKIPIIVYSVLNENNAKYYIQEELSEYFLKKDDNIDELVSLATNITSKYPLSEEYKANIIACGLNFTKEIYEKKEEDKKPSTQIEEKKELIIDETELNKEFKENYDFSYSDERIFSNIFSILYPLLNYDLFILNVYTFDSKEHSIYFDIRDIILSPIFQNAIANKYHTQDIVLFKQYSPNLKMIINEDEFYSKIEFEFEYNGKNTGNVAFYSQKKDKWNNQDNLEKIKNALENFFKARYLYKISMNNKDNYKTKYNQNNKFELNILNKFENLSEEETFVAIIEINNFSDFKSNLSQEELDIINSKISEKIINYLDKDEQIYKNDEDEYIAVIFTKDEKHALNRLNCIANLLSQISYNNISPEVSIGASNCNISNTFNIHEAQKYARSAIELTTKQEKVVIKNVGQ